MTSLGPHTITVVRPGRRAGDYGTTTVPDWGNTTTTTYEGCSVQPAPGAEYTTDRQNVTSRWQVWADSSCDLQATDRVEWAGDTYDVDGEVQRWGFPPLAHLVATLVRSADT